MHITTHAAQRALAVGVALAAIGTAQAQVLEEVIVTAEKRSASLQDTPISIISLSAETLRTMRISSVGDIAYHVPNLSMTPFPSSPSAPRLFIRGVGTGDPQVTTDTSVGVYLDGVYLARSLGLGLELADIERIEVLRGPQGTLYGRNTTGGALNIVSVLPDSEVAFSQDLSLGELSLLRAKTMLNVPLSDTLFARLTYAKHERDGLIKNTGEGEDFGAYDKQGARAALRWLPNDQVTVDYTYDWSESDFSGHYYQLLEPNANFAPILPVASGRLDEAALPSPYIPGDSTADGHALTVAIETALGEVKSITAYRTVDEFSYQDYSANSFLNVLRNVDTDQSQNQLSQELQLIGRVDDAALDYTLGVYYFRERGDVFMVSEIGLINALQPAVDVSAENSALAAYAQVSWRPAPDSPWEFTASARYTADERWADKSDIGVVEKTFKKFTPAATVRYELSDSSSVYAKIANGYKSGGFNVRAADFTQPFDPETLTSYELGWKSELLQRRVRLNAALFYADYEDMQLDIVVPDQPNPAFTQTQNAGEADISGIELDLEAVVTSTLQLSLSYGYLDTEVNKVEGDDRRFWTIQNAPQNQVSTALTWDAAKWDDKELVVSADYAYRTEINTSARPNPPGDPGDYIPGYGIANMRIALSGTGWNGQGRFEVAAWVSNMFDSEYRIEGQGSFYQLHANKLAVYGAPQLFGIDLRYEI